MIAGIDQIFKGAIMNKEYSNNLEEYKGALQESNMEFRPVEFLEEPDSNTYTKIPLSRLAALGTAFEPIASAVQTVFKGSDTVSGLYKVTIPKGTHLAEFNSGAGYLGTALNANNQIAGQAVLNPLVCNPTMLFMAAALASINKKLDAIQELQKEMMEFLEQKEKAELRGNLVFLGDLFNNYKYNWNNDMYKSSSHIKVLDIRQTAEQKVLFLRDQISSKIKKKSFFHSDKDAKKKVDKIKSSFEDYQIALYTHAFSSFMDVMLIGNYDPDYLDGIKQKIEEYAWQYRELYTECYNQLEKYSSSSIQSALLKSLKVASNSTGKAIAKVPLINKGPVDEALLAAGDKLDEFNTQRVFSQMKKMAEHQSSCVRPFVENIEMTNRLYNHPLTMVFDQDAVYLGSEMKSV